MSTGSPAADVSLEELLAHNERFAAGFDRARAEMARRPTRRLAIVTCMDARLTPNAALGLTLGEANVIRNAGAVVSEDVIRSLVVSNLLLGTRHALVIGHTKCGMVDFTNEDVHARLASERGVDGTELDFYPFRDVTETVVESVHTIRRSPLLDFDDVAGLVYDVESGRLQVVTA